jgi:putative transposase
MEVSEAKRLKALEAENAKLKSWRDQQRPQWGVCPE